ncbi:Laccase-3 [Armadillidium nasatum]|uniref:Laccase-3 n=1 Tax=Armadillidium nasatum TaxID=96803 RepID=A0A5N5SY34_9CRUS|nr:Laccase-3 [Armadillidium nasatum]
MVNPMLPSVPLCPIPTLLTLFLPSLPELISGTPKLAFKEVNGVFGAMVVKMPKGFDPNEYLYDEDLQEHIVMINDWTHIFAEEKFYLHLMSDFTDFPKSILINGVGPLEGDSILSIPHPVNHKRFQVVKGTKYRFRVINAAFLNCPVTMTIDSHLMTVIASDGAPIQPYNVTSIVIHPGERWDFGHNDCVHDSIFQLAILDYVSHIGSYQHQERLPYTSKPQYSQRKPQGKQLNEVLKDCNSENVCLRNLDSTYDLPQSMKQKTADVTLFLEVERGVKNLESFKTDQDFEESETLLSSRYSYPTINGFVHRSPSTALIFKENFPSKCDLESGGKYFGNKCLHIIKIPLGSVTDVFLMDEGKDDLTSSFHLHGFRFYVLSEGRIKKKGDK